MKKELYTQQPLFEKLIKSNMSIAELLVISDAIYNHYFDVEYRFAIVEALKCEQAVLGMIGDFIIQVDVIAVSFTYAEIGNGYQISVRSCHENLEADKIATYVCEEIGGGGGHKKKGGGRIIKTKMEEKYVGMEIFDVVNLRLCQYIEQNRKK